MREALVFFFLFLSLGCPAQKKERQAVIIGQVKNGLTHELLGGVRLTLMNADSTIVDSAWTQRNANGPNMKCIYYFNVTADMPHYILKAEKDGYETAFLRLPAKKMKRSVTSRIIDPIYLKRKPRQREVELGEVVVKATKVKFYHKGDTVVYNADAFQLAEGSMLDGLIRQLPGAELRDDGSIYVNGKHVESLLLNGDDFFKGNNRIMLDNLPAYMVSQVKVYDKASKQGEMLKGTGRRLGDEQFVMDVKLKKHYDIGWFANAEGGGGTHDRWLGRLFATRFTTHSRVSLFANANNLNDTRRPGESTQWTPETMPSGNNTNRQVGIDYNIKERDELYTLKGDAVFTHNDANTLQRNNTENYLVGGSSWTRTQSIVHSHSWGLQTNHDYTYQPNRRNKFNLMPAFSYSHWRNRSHDLSATFNVNPDGIGLAATALIDSISLPTAGPLLRRLAANRYLNEANTFTPSFALSRYMGDNKDIHISFEVPLRLTNAGMDYRQASWDGHYHKRTFFANPSFYFRKMWDGQSKDIVFQYALNNETPDLVRFIDVRNDEDPLNIRLGNPNLKTQRVHSFHLQYDGNNYQKQTYFYVFFNTTLYDNLTAMGYAYNRSTGVRTWKPVSVDGSRSFQLSAYCYRPLDKQRKINLYAQGQTTVERNADVMSVTDDTSLPVGETGDRLDKSTVTNTWAVGQVGLTWQVGKATLGLSVFSQYVYASSHRSGFTNRHVWNYHYGPTVRWNLPWRFSLSTDFTVYGRRGYGEDGLNTNDMVWNARLSKEITQGALDVDHRRLRHASPT